MTINSVTFIAGGDKSGKSSLAKSLEAHNYRRFIVDEDCKFPLEKIKQFKEYAAEYHAIIVGAVIYDLVDYSWGSIPKYYISCKVEQPFIFEEDKPSKPILGD